MRDDNVAVHVHVLDQKGVIEEYRANGYVLKERKKPTIICQGGFDKLIFVRAEPAEATKNTKAYLG